MAIHRGIACLLLICLINASVADDSVSKRVAESAVAGAASKETFGFIFGYINEVLKNRISSCTVNVENKSSYKLVNFKGVVLTGKLEKPGANIQPQQTATLVPRSGNTCPMGSSGIVSWQIEGTDTRLVVMWRLKVIKRTMQDKNTFWLALTPSESFNLNDWKTFVVSNTEVPNELNCKKGISSKKLEMTSLQSKADKFTAEGIMGTGRNPTLSITLSEEKSWLKKLIPG